jgi:hypothetical protein
VGSTSTLEEAAIAGLSLTEAIAQMNKDRIRVVETHEHELGLTLKNGWHFFILIFLLQ